MANVTVDFDQGTGDITFQVGGAAAKRKNITTLNSLLDPAALWTSADEFRYEQEYINYLDTIKDGKLIPKNSSLPQGRLLGQITVTPPLHNPDGTPAIGAPLPQHAMYGNLAAVAPALPTYPGDLDNLTRLTLDNAVSQGQIEEATGLPQSNVKACIASKLPIEYVFHDCGSGPKTYCQDGFKIVNNIAQYIDPATDMQFKEVYPARGETITFSSRFMHLFGLGGPPGPAGGPANGFESEIVATATSLRNFNYQIKCYGHEFGWHGAANADPYRWVAKQAAKPDAIFTGNNEKNKEIMNRSAAYGSRTMPPNTPDTVATALASAAVNFKHCRNLLAGKEWGDKLQVLSVLVFKTLERGKSYVLLTNDKVVFTLAMSLGVRTIWNAKDGGKDTIRHFNPTTPADTLLAMRLSFPERQNLIVANNRIVITSLERLSTNTHTTTLGWKAMEGTAQGPNWHFSTEFYTKILDDLKIINNFLGSLVLSRALLDHSNANTQDGIIRIRTLKGYLEHFSFKDIIDQHGQTRSFTHLSDRYTDVLLPTWTSTEAKRSIAALTKVAALGQKIIPDPPAADTVEDAAINPLLTAARLTWDNAHQIHNLKELVKLMIYSGAAIGRWQEDPFNGGQAAVAKGSFDNHHRLARPQATSFFHAARPYPLSPQEWGAGVHPWAWQGAGPPMAPGAAGAAGAATVRRRGGGKRAWEDYFGASLGREDDDSASLGSNVPDQDEGEESIETLFKGTELNTEAFTVTDINKRTGEILTIDKNKRLRDIITLKTGLQETDSMHAEICKVFLETSEEIYIHEFDEVIEENGETNIETIKDFNNEINIVYAKYYPDYIPVFYDPRADPITQLDLLQAKLEEVIALEAAAGNPAAEIRQLAEQAVVAGNPATVSLLAAARVAASVQAARVAASVQAAAQQASAQILQAAAPVHQILEAAPGNPAQTLPQVSAAVIKLVQERIAAAEQRRTVSESASASASAAAQKVVFESLQAAASDQAAVQQILQEAAVQAEVQAEAVKLHILTHAPQTHRAPTPEEAQGEVRLLHDLGDIPGDEKAVVQLLQAAEQAAAGFSHAAAYIVVQPPQEAEAIVRVVNAALTAAVASAAAGAGAEAQQAALTAAAQAEAGAEADPEDVQQAVQAAQVIAQQAAAQAVAVGGDESAYQAADQQIQAAALAIVTGADMVAAVHQAVAEQQAAAAQQAAAQAAAAAGQGGKKKKQTKRKKKKKNTKRKGKRSNIKKTKNKKKRASNGQKKKKKKTKRGV